MTVIEFRKCKNCKYTGKKYVCMNCFNYSKYETNKNRIRKAPLDKRI